jgi:hypothetical protein
MHVCKVLSTTVPGVCQWYAVTSRHPRSTRACSFKTPAVLDSWNGHLTTADTPGFLNSKAGEALSTSPQQTLSFFSTHIVHAVGYRPHTALTCLPGIFMHPHRMDDRGSVRSVKHLWAVGNHGCLTHRQKHETRQLPLGPVVDSSRCLRLASAPPWEHLPPLIH